MTIGLDDLVSDADRLTPARAAYVKAQLMDTIAGDVRRRRMVRTGVGVGAAATVAASALYVTIGSAPPASASWNAVPRAVAISLDDPMVQQCLHELPGGPAAQVGSSAILPAVAEARGSSRAALLNGSDSQAICIATPSTRTGGRTLAPALRRGDKLSITGDGGSTDVDGLRYVYGRASHDVASVVVTTSTGLEVTSSVSAGSFVAWWPGGDSPARVVAEDASGVVIATITPSVG